MKIVKGRVFSYEEIYLLAEVLDEVSGTNFYRNAAKRFSIKDKRRPQFLRKYLLLLYGRKRKDDIDNVLNFTKYPLHEMPMYIDHEWDLKRCIAKWRLRIGK